MPIMPIMPIMSIAKSASFLKRMIGTL